MVYSQGLKTRLLQRMSGPDRITANALSEEVGISQATLSRWLRDAGSLSGMESKKGKGKAWTAEEKLRVLGQAATLSDEQLGAFLRSEGVHVATLRSWQEAAASALAPTKGRKKKSAESKTVARLERELLRKDKALAELAALITLQKKVQAIWGDGADATNRSNET
jgi:hypothetical protein